MHADYAGIASPKSDEDGFSATTAGSRPGDRNSTDAHLFTIARNKADGAKRDGEHPMPRQERDATRSMLPVALAAAAFWALVSLIVLG
jgi:hypothetical protein